MENKNNIQKKRCTHCKRELELSMFYNNKCAYDGLTNECKDCIKERREFANKGSFYNVEYYETKIKNICNDFNTIVQNPDFKLNGFTMNINSLNNCELTLQIPLPKNTKLVNAEYLFNYAMSEITILDEIYGELKVLFGIPTIIINGKVKL